MNEQGREKIKELDAKNAIFDLCGIEWTCQTRYSQVTNGYAEMASSHGQLIQLELGRTDGEHIDYNENNDELPRDLNESPLNKDIHLAFEFSDEDIRERDLEGYLDFKENATYLMLESLEQLEATLAVIKRVLSV